MQDQVGKMISKGVQPPYLIVGNEGDIFQAAGDPEKFYDAGWITQSPVVNNLKVIVIYKIIGKRIQIWNG